MPNKKDNPKSDSREPTGNKPDREFETQGQNKGFGTGQKEQPGKSGSGSKPNTDDDEMNTAGGRKGEFSEKDRNKDSQWSPGSGQSTNK